ncbi:MAG: hypothetical protein IKK08_06940 [Clostridia bacterium]|nr:hypothetical protein [Clostridia bacterium]
MSSDFISPLPTGVVGTVTYKVSNSAPAGDYTISVSATGVSVSGGTTVTIPAPTCTHTWDNGTETTAATCETAGVKTFTCTQCGETKTEAIAAKGHTTANGETVNPTCTEDGYTTGVCSVCGKELEKQVLPATGHKTDGGKETKAATCTEKGVKTHTCTVCQTVLKTEEIAASGHKDDGGKETKAPTCTEKGVKTYTCTVCGDVTKTEEIAALGHKDDGGKETTKATCTEKGVKTYTCTVCGDVTKTEEIAALGHKPGDWVTVKEATDGIDGLKEKYCSVCNATVDSKVIPFAKWKNRTVTTAGIRFRDEGDLTDEWYMFTPVDLSVDGEQTIDLIAANKHVIGTLTVNVADGKVTVTYEASKRVVMKRDFFTFFEDLASVTTLEESQLTGYTLGEAISIDEQLGGDTKVLLYFNGLALYREDARGLDSFPYATEAYKQHVEELKSLMD